MLSRQEWSIPKIQYDVYSLESLIQWLEKQPAELEYDFHNCDGLCLLDQYGDAMGLIFSGYADHYRRYIMLCEAFNGGKYGEGPRIACTEPWTFGAALSRARAYRGQP